MSNVKELAEAEARRAEAEHDDDDTTDHEGLDPDAEATPVAEPELPPFDPKKLEGELRRHEREMAKILGDGWEDMEACGTCGGAGFMPTAFEPIRPDPTLVRCDSCGGHGQRETPSLDSRFRFTGCTDCAAKGYLTAQEAESLRLAREAMAYTAPAYPPPPPPQPVWNATSQQWETPNGAPAYVSPPPAPVPPPA